MTGNSNVGKELIDSGAEVDIEDNEGKTALMQATVNNHHELIKVRLEHYKTKVKYMYVCVGAAGSGGGSR